MANETKQHKLSQSTLSKTAALPPRKQRYVEGLSLGKSKRQAALDAGYSETVANHAKEKIETEDVTQAFRAALDDVIPFEHAAIRIRESMDAIETRTYTHLMGSKLKGTEKVHVTEKDYINYSERTRAAALWAKLRGIKGAGGSIEAEDQGQRIIVNLNI